MTHKKDNKMLTIPAQAIAGLVVHMESSNF